MSDPVRIALVAEGPTDKIVIEAAIRNLLGESPFIIQQLQPEESVAFVNPQYGMGWGGVYRWCSKARERSHGAIEQDILFQTYKVLIVHLDAEVAAENYGNAGIVDAANDLPCDSPCPPPTTATNALRAVLNRWLALAAASTRIVFCTPSRSTEAWVLSALYPNDQVVTAGTCECCPAPETRLQVQAAKGRLVSGGKKRVPVYRLRSNEISSAWPHVRATCSEAERFSLDFGNSMGIP